MDIRNKVLHLNRNDNGVIAITTTTMENLSISNTKIISMDFSSNFISAFEVFKKGKTSDWVKILIPKSEYSNELHESKKSFYINLGYSVK